MEEDREDAPETVNVVAGSGNPMTRYSVVDRL